MNRRDGLQGSDDRRTGYGERGYPDGSRYFGNLLEGKPQGAGMIRRPNGTVYEGEFDKGVPHGTGVLTQADGTRYRGTWDRGRAGPLTLIAGGAAPDGQRDAAGSAPDVPPKADAKAPFRARLYEQRGKIVLGVLGLYFLIGIAWSQGLIPQVSFDFGPSRTSASVAAVTEPAPAPVAVPEQRAVPQATAAAPESVAEAPPALVVLPPVTVPVSDTAAAPGPAAETPQTARPVETSRERLIRLGERIFPGWTPDGKHSAMFGLPVVGGWQALLANPDDEAVLAAVARAYIAKNFPPMTASGIESVFRTLDGDYRFDTIHASVQRLYPDVFRAYQEARDAALKDLSELFDTVRDRSVAGEPVNAPAYQSFDVYLTNNCPQWRTFLVGSYHGVESKDWEWGKRNPVGNYRGIRMPEPGETGHLFYTVGRYNYINIHNQRLQNLTRNDILLKVPETVSNNMHGYRSPIPFQMIDFAPTPELNRFRRVDLELTPDCRLEMR